MPRCYKQDKLGVALSEITAGAQLWETGNWSRGEFWNPEEGGKSAVGSHNQAMASEEGNRLRTPSVSCSGLWSV
jgi:hypothetical protein